jgi:serine/threonine protein kinase
MSDEDRSDDEMIGQTISSYRIESRLGAGSLGTVFRAANVNHGKIVAIKVASDQSESSVRRLYRSCEILAHLDHTSIVQLWEVGQFDGVAYCVMEFVPGLTLAKVIAQRGALSWPEVVELGVQMCAALTHIHERGVVHRNLKPSHLIQHTDGQLKLVGFGLATRDGTTPVTDAWIEGTPGYIAPEQIGSTRPISNRATDLYSLGIVLWNLLTGETSSTELIEFGQGRDRKAAAADLAQPARRPSERCSAIPKALDDLIAQLTDHAPDVRPPDAAAVASVLSRLSE